MVVKCNAKTGKHKRCSRNAHPNGYCTQHAYVSIDEILTVLDTLQRQTQAHPELDYKFNLLRERIKKNRKLCDDNPDSQDCHELLTSLNAEVTSLMTKIPMNRRSEVKRLTSYLKVLARTPYPEQNRYVEASGDAQAAEFEARREAEEARRLEDELRREELKRRELEETKVRGIRRLAGQVKLNAAQREKAVMEAERFKQQADRTRAAAHIHSAALTDQLSKTEMHNRELRMDHETQVQREARLEAMVEILNGKVQESTENYKALKRSFAEKLETAKREFSERAVNGDAVLTNRETALKEQVRDLSKKLNLAINGMEQANEAGKRALAQRQAVQNHTSVDLATDLSHAHRLLAKANHDLSEKQVLIDQMNLKSSERSEAVVKKALVERKLLEKEIRRLGMNITIMKDEATQRDQETINMRKRTAQVEAEADQRVESIKAQLETARRKLVDTQARLKAKESIEQMSRASMEREHNRLKESTQQDYETRVESLKEEFNGKVREMKLKHMALMDKLQNNQYELDNAKKDVERTSKSLEKEKESIETQKLELQTTLNRFTIQRDKILQELAESRKKADQYFDIERRQKERLEIETRRYKALKRESSNQIKELQARLLASDKATAKLQIVRNKLDGEKAALLRTNSTLNSERDRLKSELLTQKNELETLRMRYEQHMTMANDKTADMKMNLERAAELLKDNKQVHEHVEKLTEELKSTRRNLQSHIKKAEGNQKALQSAQKNAATAKADKVQLEIALKSCAMGQKQAESSLATTQSSLRTAQDTARDLNLSRREIMTKSRNALRQRESRRVRESARAEVEKDRLRAEISRRDRNLKRLDEANRTIVRNSTEMKKQLLREEVQSARTLNAVVNASR